MKKFLTWCDELSNDAGYAWILFKALRQFRRERPELGFFARIHLALESMRESTVYAQTQMAIKYGKPDDQSPRDQ